MTYIQLFETVRNLLSKHAGDAAGLERALCTLRLSEGDDALLRALMHSAALDRQELQLLKHNLDPLPISRSTP